MATYTEIKNQMSELARQAEEARRIEAPRVIASIREQIKEFDLQPEDLFPGINRSAKSTSPEKRPTKYRGPNGETWSGGSGRKPDWIRKIIDEGGDIEKYAV